MKHGQKEQQLIKLTAMNAVVVVAAGMMSQ
jgi:hypothetical protein